MQLQCKKFNTGDIIWLVYGTSRDTLISLQSKIIDIDNGYWLDEPVEYPCIENVDIFKTEKEAREEVAKRILMFDPSEICRFPETLRGFRLAGYDKIKRLHEDVGVDTTMFEIQKCYYQGYRRWFCNA